MLNKTLIVIAVIFMLCLTVFAGWQWYLFRVEDRFKAMILTPPTKLDDAFYNELLKTEDFLIARGRLHVNSVAHQPLSEREWQLAMKDVVAIAKTKGQILLLTGATDKRTKRVVGPTQIVTSRSRDEEEILEMVRSRLRELESSQWLNAQ